MPHQRVDVSGCSYRPQALSRPCLPYPQHVTQLQQQHIAEISQRDYLLQRCRDTIAALEARLAAAGLNGAPGAAGGGAGGDGGKGTGEGAGGGASAGGAAAGVAGEPGVSDIERARDCCGAAVGWCCGP